MICRIALPIAVGLFVFNLTVLNTAGPAVWYYGMWAAFVVSLAVVCVAAGICRGGFGSESSSRPGRRAVLVWPRSGRKPVTPRSGATR
jgi:hypothetical protein